MSRPHIVIDGLWRCLCPSADVAVISKTFNLARIPTTNPRPLRNIGGIRPGPKNQCQKTFHTISKRQHNDDTPRSSKHEHDSSWNENPEYFHYLRRALARNPWISRRFFGAPEELPDHLPNIDTKNIYDALSVLQNLEGTYDRIIMTVEHLVKERGEQPNERLYECLIKANVDPDRGSAESARSLAREMVEMGIQTSPRIYHALLEVRSGHSPPTWIG